MTLEHIHDKEQLREYLKEEAIVLFKHSSTCPVSGAAYAEFTKFTESHPEFPSVYLVVQEDRELSNIIAQDFHVKHASPQAILFKNGDVAWHDSHWNITQSALTKVLEEK
ncbi:bacillithiol system redox-active protein YtxJ [Bacillus massiliigorillae]|uniref:bacillithiol system redox-active protein YtxJ n=1 Tax=Bacillus massiliigorillae TaxID=1243664 RepID=UPI00039AB38D|nr:bacillithiol system redox-active protein YtxJ [Bacillus massiliigorillae]